MIRPREAARAIPLAILFAVAACSGDLESDVPAVDQEAAAPVERTYEADLVVFLSEYTIDMPLVIDAGEQTIAVTNLGVESHNLLIRRPDSRDVLWQTDGNVEPNQTIESVLDLPPGSYLAECTFAGHDTRGMFVRLEVRPGEDTA